MRTKPRTTYALRTFIVVTLALSFGTTPALSQKRGPSRRGPTTQEDNAERRRVVKALSLLVETADQARLFEDLYYRARVQALAADALWPYDAKQARAIFRRAWEAANASDKTEAEEAEQELGTVSGSNSDFSEARQEVLKTVASRDTRMADIFLRELASAPEGTDSERNERSLKNPRSRLSERRLALAGEFLVDGDARRAAEIAAPVVNDGANIDLVLFLLRLRQQNVSEADALYLRLLQRAAADPGTGANEVLLLSPQVVSPNLTAIIDEFGALQFRALPRSATSSGPVPAVPQQTQTAFFNLAASVLLRPRGPRASLTMHELMSQFYSTGRLLPFFENPSSSVIAYAPALRARHSELFNEIEAGRREQFSAQFGVNSLTPAGYVDPLRSETEQLSLAADAAERRRLAHSIIKTAVRNRLWDRAKRAAAGLEDSDERRATLSFIQVQQIKDISKTYANEKDDEFESVATFVRNADAPAVAKVWGLAQAALIGGRSRDARNSQKVAELISEAEAHAARVSQGTGARVAAYGIVTEAAAKVIPSRAWELLGEFVKAANALEDFDDDEIEFEMAAGENVTTDPEAAYLGEPEIFRLDAIFATMAALDFEKALEGARALDGDVAQAFAVIAISRRVLEKQNAGLRTPKA